MPIALRRFAPCACLLLAACATATNGQRDRADMLAAGATPSTQAAPTFTLTTEIDPSVPERYRKSVEAAQIEGRILFREDRAAWIATDAVVAQGILARHTAGATGWLSEQMDPLGNHWNVAFTGRKDETPVVYADAGVAFGDNEPRVTVKENDPLRNLSNTEIALSFARDKVASMEWLRCSKQYNTSAQIFIDEGKKYLVIRELPAQTDVKVLPRGGFHRFRIPVFEGGQIEHFAQTNTCLDEDIRALPAEGASAMTLLTSDVPTEFDVFESLSYGRPHYVITEAGTWRIEHGKISWRNEKPEFSQ